MNKFELIGGILLIGSTLGIIYILAFGPVFGTNTDVIFSDRNQTVYIKQNVLDEMNENFLKSENLEREYMACLSGYEQGNKIFVMGLYYPKVTFANKTCVIVGNKGERNACTIPGSLGFIHSHPYGSCYPSEQDIFTFGDMDVLEPIINMIQCDEDKFMIIKMPDVDKGDFLEIKSLRWEAY